MHGPGRFSSRSHGGNNSSGTRHDVAARVDAIDARAARFFLDDDVSPFPHGKVFRVPGNKGIGTGTDRSSAGDMSFGFPGKAKGCDTLVNPHDSQ